MSRSTDEKLRSLRIDSGRKVPSRSTGAGLFLAVGFLLGLGGAAGIYVARNPNPQGPPANPPQSAGTIGIDNSGAASASTPGKPATKASAPAPKAGEVVLTASGYVTPRQRIALSPQVIGIVSFVDIEKGEHVKKDQVLVRLESDEYEAQVRGAEARLKAARARLAEMEAGSRPEEILRAKADLQEAQAALENAEGRLRRAEALVRATVESDQIVENAQDVRDRARARVNAAQQTLALLEEGPRKEQIEAQRAEVAAAEADLDYARIQLEDTVISAPIDGTILEKLIEIGELVSPQNFGGTRGARTELLSMADLSDLQVEVDINEADFARVRMGQNARVTLDAYPDRQYDARVREIAPEADRAKATIQIKVEILNPDALVRPEMGARVDLLAGEAVASAG